MNERETERRLRDWLHARAPTAVPDGLRRAVAAVPATVPVGWPDRLAAALGPRRAAVPRLAWLLLLAGLLLAALVGGLFVGSQRERRLPAIVPPVDPAFACPAGSTPDEPGPVDQARPPLSPWASAFDRRAGRLVAVAIADTVVETWTFDVCTNTWTRMHPDREPPGVSLSRLVYDVASDLTIGIHEPQGPEPRTGRVWAYDLEADTWTEHGVAPTFDTGFYDPVSGLVVGGVSEDLWYYDVETDAWTPISRQPAGRSGFASVRLRRLRRPDRRVWRGRGCRRHEALRSPHGHLVEVRRRDPVHRGGRDVGGRAHHHVRRGGGADGGRRRFPVGRL
jgi:hypothetical protein